MGLWRSLVPWTCSDTVVPSRAAVWANIMRDKIWSRNRYNMILWWVKGNLNDSHRLKKTLLLSMERSNFSATEQIVHLIIGVTWHPLVTCGSRRLIVSNNVCTKHGRLNISPRFPPNWRLCVTSAEFHNPNLHPCAILALASLRSIAFTGDVHQLHCIGPFLWTAMQPLNEILTNMLFWPRSIMLNSNLGLWQRPINKCRRSQQKGSPPPRPRFGSNLKLEHNCECYQRMLSTMHLV